MMICDAHCDLLYKRVNQPAAEPVVSRESLLAGGVSLQTMAMFGARDGSVEKAERLTETMLAIFADMRAAGGWKQVTDPAAAEPGTISCLLAIEGAEVLTRGLDRIDYYHAHGVRMVTLTWNHENALATPHTGSRHEGLKPYGLQAVRKMHERHIAVDISHLNEGGVRDILAKTDVPPLASHSACRALRDHTRNLTDDQLSALFAAGGYLGLIFCPDFLAAGRATLDTLVDHFDHLMSLGGEGKVGLGSDFDGLPQYVEGLDSPARLPDLFARLRARGYTAEQVAQIAGQSFLDYYARINTY